MKADNTAAASLKHHKFSWLGPKTLSWEWFPIKSVGAMSDLDSRIIT